MKTKLAVLIENVKTLQPFGKSLSSPSFFNSSRDEKVGTTQAGKFPKL
jgi:hypothetical protein